MADLVPLLSVLVGAGMTMVTTLLVERRRERLDQRRADAERAEQERRESREGFQALLLELQEHLESMVQVANDLVELGDTRNRRAELRRLMMRCELLRVRLPDEGWRDRVDDVIATADAIKQADDADEAREKAGEVWHLYQQVIDEISGPLRRFYQRGLADRPSTPS